MNNLENQELKLVHFERCCRHAVTLKEVYRSFFIKKIISSFLKSNTNAIIMCESYATREKFAEGHKSDDKAQAS